MTADPQSETAPSDDLRRVGSDAFHEALSTAYELWFQDRPWDGDQEARGVEVQLVVAIAAEAAKYRPAGGSS